MMSTETSVPQPRMAGLDVSDSALLATLLREAPIGFAFFGYLPEKLCHHLIVLLKLCTANLQEEKVLVVRMSSGQKKEGPEKIAPGALVGTVTDSGRNGATVRLVRVP